ncbi:hypothetical protein BDP27DRAFT_1505668 [Rhodocollybia butyracea]|uniref:Uncharacterized protein n=1 Tax=Rhodocollybia butyracea TaxID=206335 RepID=A0A9P5P4I6_9AGAR|nr:hypothetical protein BDP27DRAFT_1505668 [Rhodocollybia butyracea]
MGIKSNGKITYSLSTVGGKAVLDLKAACAEGRSMCIQSATLVSLDITLEINSITNLVENGSAIVRNRIAKAVLATEIRAELIMGIVGIGIAIASGIMSIVDNGVGGGHIRNVLVYYYRTAKKDRDSDTGKVSIYPGHKLHNWKVVRSRKNWTFNSAVTAKKEGSDESISVFVQTFEGPGAKQLFLKRLEFSRGLVNGHHLNIVGIPPSTKSNTQTDSHYIVYERAHRKDTCRLLATALVKGEKETTAVGLKTVYGIVSALAHLSKVASSLCLAQIHIEIFTEANHTVWREKLDRYLGLADTDFDFGHNGPSDDEGHPNQSQSSAVGLSAQPSRNEWESSSHQRRRELIWKSLASDMPL